MAAHALKPDFVVRNHGTIWTFTLASEAAAVFARESLGLEDWQWVGSNAFAIDWRPARDLVAQLQAEGWVVR